MNIKYLILTLLLVSSFSSLSPYASAQEVPALTATLHNETPLAQSLSAGAQYVDVARITLTASVGDVYLNGIYLNTDVSGGLSNFTNIYIYDVTSTSTLKGTYPNQSANPNLIRFGDVIIGNGGTPKTYLVKASLSSSAAGNVRLGFSGFTFPTLVAPTLIGVPIYGNTLTLPGVVATPTPAPTPQPSADPSPTETPAPTILPNPISLGFTGLNALGLSDGNTISAVGSGNPDIYIVNDWGYKRLFLNPVIFSFYGHLGGFAQVKNVVSSTGIILVTSGLFRNCETNDPKVYGIETTGEDAGILHWVNVSGAQAVADDPDFFKKVFCINSNEFNWYAKGSDYTSINQVPIYTR
ncbi:MAG: hypothetical protein AAB452_02820 [Patescibacteria group bacterium]